MLIQPTLLEALLKERPDIEKIVLKDYKKSKQNVKTRLRIYESIEKRISILEKDIEAIERIWDINYKTKFMAKILDRPEDNYQQYYYPIENLKHYKTETMADGSVKKVSTLTFKEIDMYKEDIFQTSYVADISRLEGGLIDDSFKVNFMQMTHEAKRLKIPDGFFKSVADIKYQRLYLVFLKKELKRYKEEFAKSSYVETEVIRLREAKRGRNDNKTSLKVIQTGLFVQYMKKVGIILDIAENIEVGKAFQHLTGYSYNSIRNSFGNQNMETFKKEDFEKIKETLQDMLKKVEADLEKVE